MTLSGDGIAHPFFGSFFVSVWKTAKQLEAKAILARNLK